MVQRRDLGAPSRVRLYELTDWGRELEPILLQLGGWGTRARHTPAGKLGIGSLLLGVKAGFDPARAEELRGTYELHIDADTYLVEVDGEVQIARSTARKPSATLTADIDTLRDVCEGRVTITAASGSGALRLDGDEQSIERLTTLLLAPFSQSLA